MNPTPTKPTRRSRREKALISPRPGGAPDNSPTIHRWVSRCFRSSPGGTAEPLSLTPSFRWVLAQPLITSTVSTVSRPSALSQRDSIIQPKVVRHELPWVTRPETPPTLTGLKPFSEQCRLLTGLARGGQGRFYVCVRNGEYRVAVCREGDKKSATRTTHATKGAEDNGFVLSRGHQSGED